jgi:hypothetical protein
MDALRTQLGLDNEVLAKLAQPDLGVLYAKSSSGSPGRAETAT